MDFSTVNPTTGEAIKKYKHIDWKQAERKIQILQDQFQTWRRSSFVERSQFLQAWKKQLEMRKKDLALQMTLEMGKPLTEALLEIEKCIQTCDYFASSLEKDLQRFNLDGSYKENYVSYQPLGVVFSIMPWNFPLWQVVRFAVPAIAAGNVVLLKHSDLTAGFAQMIEETVLNADPNQTLLQNCHVDHKVAAQIITDPRIRGVTFTGSTQGGKAVAAQAAAYLKKAVLELGGSDPYVVFADADVDRAAELCAKARLVNNGQSCVAAKRFIVQSEVLLSFNKKFIETMASFKIGDPQLPETQLGPLASQKFQSQILEQLELLQKWGGEVLWQAPVVPEKGFFFPPAVVLFRNSPPEMRSLEIFGPVACIFEASNHDHAFQLANDSIYGLGGALFTSDIEKGRRLVEQDLQAGFVVLNGQVRSDPRLPFGGIKDSGFGRELGSFGLHEFCNIKTVGINTIL